MLRIRQRILQPHLERRWRLIVLPQCRVVSSVARTRSDGRPAETPDDGIEELLSTHSEAIQARAGDVLVPLDQPQARYAVETLEPEAHDSFFRWGFFNSVLEKKQASISAYAFEDTALEMLADEPALRQAFDEWKAAHPEQLSDPQAVLGFLFTRGRRHAEPEWRRYPVAALM